MRQSISENTVRNQISQGISTLVISNITENAKIKIYPNCIEYIPAKTDSITSGFPRKKRGTVSKFSKKARFRLFRLMAKISNELEIDPLFMTLTYHYGHEKKDINTKSQLHTFLVRLRQLDPGVQYIWRIEYQKRNAPHYHLIIFPSEIFKHCYMEKYIIECSRIWHSIADPASRAHKEYGCKTVTITSYKMACMYISKYVGKVPGDDTKITKGKHYGNSQNLPFDLRGRIDLNTSGAKAIIEKLRKWLIEHGKSQYTDPIYFNADREQTVFISSEIFDILIYPNLEYNEAFFDRSTTHDLIY